MTKDTPPAAFLELLELGADFPENMREEHRATLESARALFLDSARPAQPTRLSEGAALDGLVTLTLTAQDAAHDFAARPGWGRAALDSLGMTAAAAAAFMALGASSRGTLELCRAWAGKAALERSPALQGLALSLALEAVSTAGEGEDIEPMTPQLLAALPGLGLTAAQRGELAGFLAYSMAAHNAMTGRDIAAPFEEAAGVLEGQAARGHDA